MRLGNAVSERKIKIKCINERMDFYDFIEDWGTLLEIRISRAEKMVPIIDIGYALNILIMHGRKLLSHHLQRSRRY